MDCVSQVRILDQFIKVPELITVKLNVIMIPTTTMTTKGFNSFQEYGLSPTNIIHDHS